MCDDRITFRLSPEEKQKLREMAEKKGITLSELIRQLCEEIFQK